MLHSRVANVRTGYSWKIKANFKLKLLTSIFVWVWCCLLLLTASGHTACNDLLLCKCCMPVWKPARNIWSFPSNTATKQNTNIHSNTNTHEYIWVGPQWGSIFQIPDRSLRWWWAQKDEIQDYTGRLLWLLERSPGQQYCHWLVELAFHRTWLEKEKYTPGRWGEKQKEKTARLVAIYCNNHPHMKSASLTSDFLNKHNPEPALMCSKH